MKRTLASSSLLTTILFSLTVVALSLHGVRLIAAGTAVAASSSPSYGLEWSGDGSVRRMLYWHNPFPIYDATYVFKVYPRKKTSGAIRYYTTFFWGNDGRFDWDNGNDNSYYGAHPYPIPAPGGPGQWEIAVWGGDYVTGSEVQWDRWYTQAFRAWRESPSITHHEFYWDWPDTSKVISQTVEDPNWAHKNPPIPAIVIGQAPDFNGASWGGYPGWEEFKGIIRGIQIYSGLLSMADLQAEINAPQSTTAGQNLIWYLNTDPRPSDVTDKKGTGTPHNPSWAGATASEWTDQTSPPPPPPPSFDFSLANGGNQTVVQGQSVSSRITATLVSGTPQPVSFSASGLPTGATAAFSPGSCSPTCSSTLTLTTSASTPTGSSTITVTGASGSLSHTTTFTLTVNAPPPPFDFSLSNGGNKTVVQGQSVSSTITATLVSGTIRRAHVSTPVTSLARMPSSASK